ncbi:MAG: iron ABC transporter permease [Rikenellaceae bacterium]
MSRLSLSPRLQLGLLLVGVVGLFFANLIFGAVKIPFDGVVAVLSGESSDVVRPSWIYIIKESRLPQAFTALLAGSALAVSGLMLQTLFRNPLAGPSILGISDGANLGVAIVMLAFGGSLQFIPSLVISGYLTLIFAAILGAMAVLGIIIWFSSKVQSNTMLLIVGIMVGYMVSSMISILNFRSSADKVHAFVMWGMGNFSGVSMDKLPYFAAFILLGLGCSLLLIKPLNALLLGERYAANLGVRIKPARIAILLCTGVLTATATAFCGPISFIGLAVPHMARLLLGSSNHNYLVPLTILCGGCIALLCNLLTVLPGDNQIFPLNAVTPILGAPVIIYVIVNRKNIQYFN